jgi:hypothetical protein
MGCNLCGGVRSLETAAQVARVKGRARFELGFAATWDSIAGGKSASLMI